MGKVYTILVDSLPSKDCKWSFEFAEILQALFMNLKVDPEFSP